MTFVLLLAISAFPFNFEIPAAESFSCRWANSSLSIGTAVYITIFIHLWGTCMPPLLVGWPGCESALPSCLPHSVASAAPNDAAPPNLQSGALLIVVRLLSVLSVTIKHAASTATQSHRPAFASRVLASTDSWRRWCRSLKLLRCWHAAGNHHAISQGLKLIGSQNLCEDV